MEEHERPILAGNSAALPIASADCRLGILTAMPPFVEAHLSCLSKLRRFVMLYWTAVFFVIALVAAVLGFSGLAGAAAGAAKVLFFAFLIIAAISLLFHKRVPA